MATQLTGTITVASGSLKATGASTVFGKFPNDTNGYEQLVPGDFVLAGTGGVFNLREVTEVDENNQCFYVSEAFDNALTAVNFYRVAKNDGQITCPAFTLASNYSIDKKNPKSRTGIQIQVDFGVLDAADGTLQIQTKNFSGAWKSIELDAAGSTSVTIASGSTRFFAIDGFALGEYVKVLFTRNSVTSGTIKVLFASI